LALTPSDFCNAGLYTRRKDAAHEKAIEMVKCPIYASTVQQAIIVYLKYQRLIGIARKHKRRPRNMMTGGLRYFHPKALFTELAGLADSCVIIKEPTKVHSNLDTLA
jgi:hypothetical protein